MLNYLLVISKKYYNFVILSGGTHFQKNHFEQHDKSHSSRSSSNFRDYEE